MMSITSIVKSGLVAPFSAIKYLNHTAPRPVRIAFKAANAAVYGAYAHHYIGQHYGAGTTGLIASLSAVPVLGFIANKVLMAKVGLDNNTRKQIAKTRSSFATQRIDDRFGTIKQMRQESHKRLIRDRNNVNRALGNEAFHFHGR